MFTPTVQEMFMQQHLPTLFIVQAIDESFFGSCQLPEIKRSQRSRNLNKISKLQKGKLAAFDTFRLVELSIFEFSINFVLNIQSSISKLF